MTSIRDRMQDGFGSSEPYPIPSYAAQVWLAGDNKLTVAFPPLPGHEKGHTTLIPCTEDGIKVLRSVLAARAEGFSTGAAHIATKGSPTQYNLAEMIKAMKVTRIEPKKDGSKIEDISEIGL